ncbi:hypothetical protein [Legionella donaldsonii]|uniref:hypothetical protein n=1 Tax=Legionella donaldsonii TaxID=45060 RepID=UPI00399CDC7A
MLFVEAITEFLAGNADGRDFLESELFSCFTSRRLFEANENSNLASGFCEVSKIATRVGAVLKNCWQLTEWLLGVARGRLPVNASLIG